MEPTQTLPGHYLPAGVLSVENRKVAVGLNLAGLGLLAVFGWLFGQAAVALRPELGLSQLAGSLARLPPAGLLLGLAGALLGVLALHELVHGFFFWRFTGDRPVFGLNLLYAYAAAPVWYLPRRQFAVVGLAPLVLITLAGLMALPFMPPPVTPFLLLALTVNAAGAAGDLIMVGWLFTQPADLLVRDSGTAITLYRPGPAILASLARRWDELMAAFGVPPAQARPLLADLASRYTVRGRHYHNLDHVRQVLETIGEFQALARDLLAVQLAAWFHDVVYSPRANDNEARSAAYARAALRQLGLPAATIDRVSDLILATASHQAAGDDVDAHLLLDADLAILGAPPAQYDRYAQAIRQEYAWVPEATYRTRRQEVLARFLAWPRLYHTPPLFAAREVQARQNLTRELEGH